MDIGGIISAIVVGLILGVVARAIRPGKQDIPIWLTIVVGIVAAFIGSLLARLVGVENTDGIDWIEILFQIIVAVVGVGLVAGLYGGRKGVNR
ncbi:MAG: GlsB/YeaQ/YmgE family stress response membrane protein [Geodermatophilaceae bacterium]|nr:GlsB/YeaQ/YmgE family stress response membrane protein [Geodermatophilaceae bacterium]